MPRRGAMPNRCNRPAKRPPSRRTSYHNARTEALGEKLGNVFSMLREINTQTPRASVRRAVSPQVKLLYFTAE